MRGKRVERKYGGTEGVGTGERAYAVRQDICLCLSRNSLNLVNVFEVTFRYILFLLKQAAHHVESSG